MAKKTKTAKQVRFLFSKGSPLNKKQEHKLAKEIRTHKIKVIKKSKRHE